MAEFLELIVSSELWLRIFPSLALIFAATQLYKVLFRALAAVRPKAKIMLNTHIIQLVSVLLAYPATLSMMLVDGNELTSLLLPIPHSIIAWSLAAFLHDKGMPRLEDAFPTAHKIFGGNQR